MDFIPLTSTGDMAQLEADKIRFQQRQQLAQSLMNSGYVPNSGKTGVFTSALSALMGGLMQRGNNEKMSDLLRREFDQQNKAAMAKRQQELADEERKFNEEIQKIGYTAKSKRDYAAPEFKDGGVFDPTTGTYTPNQGWMSQQLGLKAAEAKIAAANRAPPADPFAKVKAALAAGVITPEQAQQAMRHELLGGGNAPAGYRSKDDGSLEFIPGGPADPSSKAPTPLTAEAKNKLALIDNAIANATKYQQRVAPGGGQFNDVASMTSDTPELMKSAIQDMLYAKSGASAPVEEVRKANEMYGPSRMHLPLFGETPIPIERDSTSSAKVANFLADMRRMRDEIAGGQGGATQAQQAQPQPTQTAVNPQTGQRIGLVNGQWVPL